MPIDLDMYFAHTEGKGLVEVLLRGHLWVETHLIGLIEAEVANPAALSLDRMAFSQKVRLADALGLLSPREVGTLRTLNKMRNKLAHDLGGEPTEDDLTRLESTAPESQRGLAAKLVATTDQEAGPASGEHGQLARRLSMAILALLTELEQHSLQHAYWKKHRAALEGYRTMVAVIERLGGQPESLEDYRRAVDIPEPPTPQDALLYDAGEGSGRC